MNNDSEHLREQLERTPMSLRELASKAGVSVNTIRKARSGETLRRDAQARLLDVLGWPSPEPSLETLVLERLDHLGERLGAVETAMDGLDGRLHQVERRFDPSGS